LRLGFFRRKRVRMLHSGRAHRKIFAAATLEAGAHGTDSLDLLVATLDTTEAKRVIKALGADPQAIQSAARGARTDREPEPGLSLDAKAVVEAVAQRVLLAGTDSDIADVLVALAAAKCLAREVLGAHGIDAAGLVAQVGGPLPT
jgi:hypothetical protein